ncbi:MAG TPA: hypothetical protein PKI68_02930 [Pontiellaceae bacterium]|nr:hypothetical protein [Pontiellaceae bacterium]
MRSMWLMITIVLAMGLQTVFAEEPAPMTPVMLSFANPAQLPAENYDVNGLRIDLLYGKCRNLTGLDVGLVNYATGRETGLEVGLVNNAGKSFTGLQIGAVNVSDRVRALQIGLFNGADDMSGLQIGLINHTRIMRGCQIGLVNVIENNDLAFFPVINCFF